ncbi:succinylglutamate desuccinylase/aspartoacylase family protein [Ascidiimonas aurantiaca]|uniref:succinylglutamate desuccinylase/aspartoacylase family protein n=1 Tax=Ascidiimonas aurantiaca TaxID=1685432 RepID=UPI0030ED41CF
MVKVYSKALNQTIEIERIIGKIKGDPGGPTIIFVGGIHGNEPSGVFALQHVLETLQKKEVPVKGNIYALGGNLPALEKNERFQKQDLNRIWIDEKIQHLVNGASKGIQGETAEQAEICEIITDIIHIETGPFYFIDLHTTSSETIPFLTVNDNLLNRKFTSQYPVPVILGIEEYLEGPLLSYINELGYVAFGFEAGQHDALQAYENHVAFIYLSLVFSGVVDREYTHFDDCYKNLLQASGGIKGVYEIFYRYGIQKGEQFKMKPGFVNFQPVVKGTPVAKSDEKEVIAPENGRMFMPLYQNQGDDGFFTIRSIAPLILKLSAFLRKAGVDRILPFLPGVRWDSDKKDTLLVNRKIARFFAKQFFHLLGYRNKKLNDTYILMKNREAASREEEYPVAAWDHS